MKAESDLARVTRELREWRESAAKRTERMRQDAHDGVGAHGVTWRGWPSLTRRAEAPSEPPAERASTG